MCQAKVFLEKKGSLEVIMADVTEVEETSDGLRISAFFETPMVIPKARIMKIDFLSHTVTLAAPEE